jgi:cell division protein FtsI/penicillin-binding protein 2
VFPLYSLSKYLLRHGPGFRKRCFSIRFYVQPRTLRKYSKPIASHILGYVSEVDEDLISKDHYYKPGDYIGKLGIEQAYEKYLREHVE